MENPAPFTTIPFTDPFYRDPTARKKTMATLSAEEQTLKRHQDSVMILGPSHPTATGLTDYLPFPSGRGPLLLQSEVPF